MLEVAPDLEQAEVEQVLRDTAIDFASTGTRQVWNPFRSDANGAPLPPAFEAVPWDESCDIDGPDASEPEEPCDPVGYGLVQADAAVDAVD